MGFCEWNKLKNAIEQLWTTKAILSVQAAAFLSEGASWAMVFSNTSLVNMNAKIQGAQSSRSIGARERRWLQERAISLEQATFQRSQKRDPRAAAKEKGCDKP